MKRKIIKRKPIVPPLGFKVIIKIEGDPGTGKSIIWNLIWKALEDSHYPHGYSTEYEHVIFTALPN